MQEGFFKFTPEGEVQQTYHIIDLTSGYTCCHGSTFDEATAEAQDRNLLDGFCNWFVMFDDLI